MRLKVDMLDACGTTNHAQVYVDSYICGYLLYVLFFLHDNGAKRRHSEVSLMMRLVI